MIKQDTETNQNQKQNQKTRKEKREMEIIHSSCPKQSIYTKFVRNVNIDKFIDFLWSKEEDISIDQKMRIDKDFVCELLGSLKDKNSICRVDEKFYVFEIYFEGLPYIDRNGHFQGDGLLRVAVYRKENVWVNWSIRFIAHDFNHLVFYSYHIYDTKKPFGFLYNWHI
jgi:hypothetical protein